MCCHREERSDVAIYGDPIVWDCRALFAMTKRHTLRARNDTIILLNYFDIGTFRFV